MTTPTDITNYVEKVKKDNNISLDYNFNGFMLIDFINDVEHLSSKYNVILLDQDVSRESYQTRETLYLYHYNTKLVYKRGKLITIYINPKLFITYQGRSLKKMFDNEYESMQMPNIIYEDEYYIQGKVNNVLFKVRISKI